MDSTTIYYFKRQTSNLYLQPVYNRCKFTIQLLWCSHSRPWNTLSWTSSTLNYIIYTNYTLGNHLSFISFRLFPYHTSVGWIYPLQHLYSTRAYFRVGTHSKHSHFQDFHPRNFFQPVFWRKYVHSLYREFISHQVTRGNMLP